MTMEEWESVLVFYRDGALSRGWVPSVVELIIEKVRVALLQTQETGMPLEYAVFQLASESAGYEINDPSVILAQKRLLRPDWFSGVIDGGKAG
jgi:hypothetical protein